MEQQQTQVTAPDPQQQPAQSEPVQQQASQPAEQAIPYSRFAEVIAQKNALQEQLAVNQQQQAIAAQQSQSVNTAPSTPKIDTVEDLLSVVNQKVDSALDNAYKTRLAPIEENIQNSNFRQVVEGYFSSSPERTQLRGDMDAYTATLSPQEQQFLRQSVAQGRTQWLDNIYHTVATMRQQNAQQMANQQAQQSAVNAQTPTQFKTIGNIEPSFQDKIQNAKKDGNWQNVFANMVPPRD